MPLVCTAVFFNLLNPICFIVLKTRESLVIYPRTTLLSVQKYSINSYIYYSFLIKDLLLKQLQQVVTVG